MSEWRSVLTLEVEGGLGENIPGKIIPDMIRLADRLMINVRAELNGIRVFVRPGDDPLIVAQNWQRSLETGRRIASSRFIPPPPEPDT